MLLWSLFVHYLAQAAANVAHFPHLCGWIFPKDSSLEFEQSWYVFNQWSQNLSRCWLSLKLYFCVHSSLNQPAVKFKGRFGLKWLLILISMKARWGWRSLITAAVESEVCRIVGGNKVWISQKTRGNRCLCSTFGLLNLKMTALRAKLINFEHFSSTDRRACHQKVMGLSPRKCMNWSMFTLRAL